MSKLVNEAISDLKWKASRPFNEGIKGDQISLSKERALALLAHIERLERQLKQCLEIMECNDPGNARAIFGDAG